MTQRSLFFGGVCTLIVVGVALATLPQLNAKELSALTAPSAITNTTNANALTITQKTDVGNSRSRSGALLIDNSGNQNTGLTLYSDRDDSAAQPLMRMEVDDTKWDEEILYIHSDSLSSRGLIRLDSPAPEIEFVETDQEGAAGKFEVRVQHDTFQINSRLPDDSGFSKKITMTHEGDLELHEGAIKVTDDTPSEFAGGINVTGGCIALDGVCLTGEELQSSTNSETEPTTAPSTSVAVTISNGAPDLIACNSYTERGALPLATVNHRMYVCNGPKRGWDYYELND